MRKAIRTLSLFVTVVVMTVMGYVGYLNLELPDRFYVTGTEEFSMEQLPAVTAAEELPKESQAGVSTSRVLETKLRLCGLIPIKTVNLQKVETPYVVPCGTPFGLKMLTEGVVVVGLNPVETEAGTICPAKEAGVRKGDVILRAGGKAVSGNRELAEIVRASEGKSVSLLLKRDGVELTLQVVPVKAASDEVYRCGIWVRDSSAGIGTVTFYDPSTGVFGGLGHAVCDVDTGGVMPLAEGQVVSVSIHGVQKGEAGTPGELQGSFLTTLSCGELRKNTETGVYGVLNRNPAAGREAIPICLRQEVKEGPVQILTTISGTEPALYDAVIEKVSLGDHTPTKNLILRITDPELLSKTGGIVQGMSGSPILQDGKLAGAVTHVFVNDPTRGYGIFAENMLDAAR